jgi:hypothetical protein
MNYKELLSGKKIFLIFVAFFLVRLICSHFFSWTDTDGPSYSKYSLAIINQADWLTNPDYYGNYRPPVYPMFLASIYYLFGVDNLFAVYFFQALISTITIYYIFRLANAIFGEKTSLLVLIWAGLYSYYVYYVGVVLRETLVYFLIVFSFYQLWMFLKTKEHVHFLKNRNLWKFIIAFLMLLHTDARYLFYIPFMYILFIMYRDFRTGLKQYACLVGIFILLLVPWSIRNYIAYNGFVLINTRTLDMRQTLPVMRMDKLGMGEKKTVCYNKNYPSDEERALVKQGHNPNNRSENEIDAILKDRYPTRNGIEKRWYNFKLLWRPYHFINEYKPWSDCRFDPKYSLSGFGLLKALTFGMLLPFMIFSSIYAIVRKQKSAAILILPVIVHTVFHVLMWANGRYRTPIDSFVIILGCYGIIVAYEFVRERFRVKTN